MRQSPSFLGSFTQTTGVHGLENEPNKNEGSKRQTKVSRLQNRVLKHVKDIFNRPSSMHPGLTVGRQKNQIETMRFKGAGLQTPCQGERRGRTQTLSHRIATKGIQNQGTTHIRTQICICICIHVYMNLYMYTYMYGDI